MLKTILDPIQSHGLGSALNVAKKSCFHLGLKYIFCVVFLVHPTIVMFPQCNNKNSLGKAPGNRHSFSLSTFGFAIEQKLP